MAAKKGIRSSLSTQLIPRSPKVGIYENLFLFNQRLQDIVQILKRLERYPWLRRDFLQSFQVKAEDLRAQINFEVLEHLSEREQGHWVQFGKLVRQWDRRFEDPDDVYFDAEKREMERLKQGLPPRLGVIPHVRVAAEKDSLRTKQRNHEVRAARSAVRRRYARAQ